MTKYLLAHDLGTSGNKATLYTTDGQLVKSTVYSYETHYYNNNWAEQDPEDWWKAICHCTKEVTEGVVIEDVLAVSFSGQMMGCLCVNKEGKPLRPHIIWADQRSIEETDAIRSKISEEEFYHITGHRMSPAYGVEKLMWIKNNEPDIYANTYKILNAKDYIVYRLTGQFITDYSDASSTNVFDLNTFTWSEKLIDITGIDPDILPELKPSTYVAGTITKAVGERCGLAEGTKVVLGGGDGICASIGAGSIREGLTYNYLGSSSWICTTSKKPIFDDQMRTFNWAHIVPGYVAPCGTMQTAGGAFNWLKKEIAKYETMKGIDEDVSPYELINEQVAKSTIGAGGTIFLPYLLGERSPRWNPAAKGAFIGLRMENKREDLFRAVIEGILMNLNMILQVFKDKLDIEEVTVIGGLAQGDIQRRLMADIYGVKILKPNYLEEATSMGAAVTAGVGIGVLDGFEDISKFITIESAEDTIQENNKRYQELMEIFDECYHCLVPVFDKL